jgi:hypothetical protein
MHLIYRSRCTHHALSTNISTYIHVKKNYTHAQQRESVSSLSRCKMHAAESDPADMMDEW